MKNEAGLWGQTIASPEVSNLIMRYENLNKEGKRKLLRYLDSLTTEYQGGQNEK